MLSNNFFKYFFSVTVDVCLETRWVGLCSHAVKTYHFMLNFRAYLSVPKLTDSDN